MSGAPHFDFTWTQRRATINCTLNPGAVVKFLDWLSAHQEHRDEIDWLVITHDGRKLPNNTEPDVSLCLLYRVLASIPHLDTLELRRVAFTHCLIEADADGIPHQHAPPPLAHPLESVMLDRVATRYPFDCDPLTLCNLAPSVTYVYMGIVYPHPRLPLNVVLHDPPKVVLGPPPSMGMRLRHFSFTFPILEDRQRYKVDDNWYNGARRLPTDRGTRSLTIDQIDPFAAPMIGFIVAGDASTIEDLHLSFEERFQLCPINVWKGLRRILAGCTNLRNVTLMLEVKWVLQDNPPQFAHFDAIGVLINILPPTLSRITLKLVVADDGVFAARNTILAVPWVGIDNCLKANSSTAIVEVQLSGQVLASEDAELRQMVSNDMVHALQDGRLSLWRDHLD